LIKQTQSKTPEELNAIIEQQKTIIEHQKLNIEHEKEKNLQLEKHIEQMVIISSNTAIKDKYCKPSNKKTTNNTTNNNSNTINNTTNNVINNNTIHITTHGRENTDHITIKEYNNLFKRYKKSVQMFVKLKHLDKNNKQNSNVYISNLHDKFIHVHKNKEWLIENEQDVLDEICETNSMFLIDKFRDMAEKDELSETSKRFDSFIEIMDDGESDDYDYGERIETPEKTNFKNEIKNDMKRDLYNGRHMVAPK